jgi:hypothetical protein
MRSKQLLLLLGFSIVAAAIAPAFACQDQIDASNEQQTAQAGSDVSSHQYRATLIGGARVHHRSVPSESRRQ